MSNARNLANLLGTGTTIASAKIDDDAITNAKILNDAVTGAKIEDNPTIAGNLTIAGNATAQGTTSGFEDDDKIILNATDGSATDAGDNLVLNSTDGSSDDGDGILFENFTNDGSAVLETSQKVLQVVTGKTSTNVSSTSSTYADTGLTAAITPSSSSSKILVIVNQQGCQKFTNTTGLGLKLFRGSTELVKFEGQFGINSNNSYDFNGGGHGVTHLDSPSTTSATTYKTQFNSRNNNNGVGVQTDSATSTITLMEIRG